MKENMVIKSADICKAFNHVCEVLNQNWARVGATAQALSLREEAVLSIKMYMYRLDDDDLNKFNRRPILTHLCV